MHNDNSTFRGERLRALAEMEGISLSRLAKELNISQPKISKITQNAIPLTEDLVYTARLRFSVPASFFVQVDLPQDQMSATFRKKQTTTATEDKRISRLFTEAARFWRQTSLKSGYKSDTLPQLSEVGEDPNLAAQLIRKSAGLEEDAPVRNVTRLAERNGVAVISRLDPLEHNQNGHTGISRPSSYEDRPLIATTHPLPGAVQRMTLAHELAHLIFDKNRATALPTRSYEERRAFIFAGELLLPEIAIKYVVSEDMPLNSYLRIKAQYGISVMAIIKRAQDLGLISKQRARSLYIQANSRGWRENEPIEVEDETPSLLFQAVTQVWANDTNRAALDVGVKKELIDHWIGKPTQTLTTPGQVIKLSDKR